MITVSNITSTPQVVSNGLLSVGSNTVTLDLGSAITVTVTLKSGDKGVIVITGSNDNSTWSAVNTRTFIHPLFESDLTLYFQEAIQITGYRYINIDTTVSTSVNLKVSVNS